MSAIKLFPACSNWIYAFYIWYSASIFFFLFHWTFAHTHTQGLILIVGLFPVYLNTQETGNHLKEHSELMVISLSPTSPFGIKDKDKILELIAWSYSTWEATDLKFPLLVLNIVKIKNMIPRVGRKIFFFSFQNKPLLTLRSVRSPMESVLKEVWRRNPQTGWGGASSAFKQCT